MLPETTQDVLRELSRICLDYPLTDAQMEAISTASFSVASISELSLRFRNGLVSAARENKRLENLYKQKLCRNNERTRT